MIEIVQTVLVPLLEVSCRCCGRLFCVCRCCWRGQRYCCDRCRESARQKAHRESQRRYRQTEKGRKNHREAEKRRRMGLSKKSEEIVDDAGTTQSHRRHRMESEELKECIARARKLGYRVGRCHVCGRWGVVVRRFGRRGYGQRRQKWKWEDDRYAKKA